MNIIKEKWNRGTDKPYDMTLRKVREDLRISGDAYRLYVTLYNSNTDPNVGKVFTPTTESLASQFKVGQSTIKRWLKELRTYGYIGILGSKESGYTMYISKESTVDGVKNEPIKSKKMGSKMNPSNDNNNHIDGVKNEPIDGVKNDTYYIDNGCPATSGEQPLPTSATRTKEEKVQLDVDVCYVPSAATPSEQPTSLHTSTVVDENGKLNIPNRELTNEERKLIEEWLPF